MGADVWAWVRTERLGLADEIGALSADQWATPSLCGGWRIGEVAGHLVFLAEASQLRGVWYMWRYGRGVFPNRMIDATARRWASPDRLSWPAGCVLASTDATGSRALRPLRRWPRSWSTVRTSADPWT